MSRGTVLADTRSCAFIAEIGQTCFHEQTLVMDMFPKSHLMAVLEWISSHRRTDIHAVFSTHVETVVILSRNREE